jgi:hypothetical protein
MNNTPSQPDRLFSHIHEESVKTILGIRGSVPLTTDEMARALRVTFFPDGDPSARVRHFAERLKGALLKGGVTVLDYSDALTSGGSRRLREGLVVIAPGSLTTGNLPVDHVTNLRTATIVGIVDGPCPADGLTGLQDQLNSVVRVLAWSLIQVVVFVDEGKWTVCTMNGAIVSIDSRSGFDAAVLSVLVPKLAAPVVPPRSADFEVREGGLDLLHSGQAPFARDFARSGRKWAETGLMLFHTSLETLHFRNRYYQRIAAAYLDHRSGMSYGFLARQLPVAVRPAQTLGEATLQDGIPPASMADVWRRKNGVAVVLSVAGERLVVEVPDVWVLTTRSGCDKANLDISRDLVLMGLRRGQVVLETPNSRNTHIDCKPSYDTRTILAHAVGNALVASVLARLRPASAFPRRLSSAGAALVHWHGLINPAILPGGYFVYGEGNPPVSCSTHQSAMYALGGKLSAAARSLESGVEYRGDVHVEPLHGTNITGDSLTDLAGWVLQMMEAHGVTRFSIQHAGG